MPQLGTPQRYRGVLTMLDGPSGNNASESDSGTPSYHPVDDYGGDGGAMGSNNDIAGDPPF